MNLDFEKALTYIAKDPGWSNKLLAGAGIWLASFAVFVMPFFVYIATVSALAAGFTFFVSLFLSLLLNLVIAGYFAQTASRRINFSNSFLPDWKDFGHLALTGLKYYAGFFLYMLPFALFTGIYLGALFYQISGDTAIKTPAFLFFTLFGALLLMVYILVMIFTPLMMANYFKTLKILSFVDFKEAFKMLKGNVGNYFVVLLLFLALSVLLQMALSFLVITVIGVIFIPVLYFYLYLVAAEIIAQFVLTAKEKEQE